MKKLAAAALIMLGIGIIGVMISFDRNDLRSFGTIPVDERKTVSAAGADQLIVETSGMNIEIVPGKSENIAVRIDGKASKKYADRFQLTAEARGDAVYIEGDYKETLFVGFQFVSVDLVVELPERLWKEATIKSGSGNIDIERLNAENAVIETNSGNIEAEELSAAAASLQSGSGNIEAESLKAETLTLRATSGNVKVDGYAAKHVTARTQSGNVTLEDGAGSIDGETNSGNIRIVAESLDRDVKLKADSGNVRIDVAQEPSSASIHFRTDSGSRSVDWRQFNADNDNDDELSGTIGSGRIKIDVETDSGNMKLGRK